jgi:hypothetical protein
LLPEQLTNLVSRSGAALAQAEYITQIASEADHAGYARKEGVAKHF